MATAGRRRLALGAGLAGLFLAGLALLARTRSCGPGAEGGPREAADRAGAPPRTGAAASSGGPPAFTFPEPSLAAGWEEAAEAVAADLGRVLEGHARAGAYAEARAEAARLDLQLFPPERTRLRRLLLGSERERTLALAALAARPELDDDLVRIVLRSQRPGDAEVTRLLCAEIAGGLAPDLLARHEDDLLRAFEREPNPLVLAVALPALERMEAPRLRALLRAQAAASGPEMLPVLLALARARLGPAAVEELEGSPGSGLAGR